MIDPPSQPSSFCEPPFQPLERFPYIHIHFGFTKAPRCIYGHFLDVKGRHSHFTSGMGQSHELLLDQEAALLLTSEVLIKIVKYYTNSIFFKCISWKSTVKTEDPGNV